MSNEASLMGTADVCDAHPNEVQVLTPGLKPFGGVSRCSGPVTTLLIEESNLSLRELLNTPGKGRVIVADVKGRYFSVVGDQLGALAVKNDWSGIIVNGYIRDSAALSGLPICIRAQGTCPKRGEKKVLGKSEVMLEYDGVSFNPGSYLYADEDGIILADEAFEDVNF